MNVLFKEDVASNGFHYVKRHIRKVKNEKNPATRAGFSATCRLAGDRTPDPMIKSHVLYQLSYEPIC
jgi:hypothetical protein